MKPSRRQTCRTKPVALRFLQRVNANKPVLDRNEILHTVGKTPVRVAKMQFQPKAPFPLGHNGGPPLEDHIPSWGTAPIKTYLIWKKACADPFKNLPHETILRRVKKAQAIGLTYREYSIEILERGVFLQPSDRQRIAEIKAKRQTPL